MSKTAVAALFAAVFAAVVGVILAPLWNNFWADKMPAVGAPLVALIGIFILAGIAAFGFAILHYFRVLGAGAKPVGTRERTDYDALRQRIASANGVARDYARRLEIFLDAIDRFFGDAAMADLTLFPHAFGLRKPAPLWTAPAFDRCLLLAFFYLIATIVVIWAVSNHVGPAEAALGLHVTDDWRRAATLVAIAYLAFAVWRVVHAKGLRRLAWLIVAFAVAVGAAIAGAGASVGDVADALTFAGAFAVALPVAFAVATAVALVLIIATVSVAFPAVPDYTATFSTARAPSNAIAFAVACAVAGAGAGAVVFAFAGNGVVAVAVAFAGIFAVAAAVAVACTVAGAAGAFAGYGAFAVAVAGAFVFAFAVAVAVAGPGPGADAFAVAFAAAFAFAVAFAVAVPIVQIGAGVIVGLIGLVVVIAVAGAGAVAFAFAVAGPVAFAGAFAFVVAFAFAAAFAFHAAFYGPGGGKGAVAVAFTVAVAFAGSGSGAGTGAFAVAVVGANVMLFAQGDFQGSGWRRIFPSAVLIVMIVMCFADVALLSHLDNWQIFGPLLLFLGPVTVITALFGWLSLGLTRALMRRGLEREKWWSYLYAVIDALLALAVMAFLAVAMVAAVQLFDDLAVSGGGKPVFPPMLEFLDAIKVDPGNPEYWWIYATLFSIMLPSLIVLFVAGISLARGVPGVSSWLMGKVREGEAVPAYDRLLVAMVLALDGVAGLAIALVAQGLLFWVIIWQGMPRLGMGVLDLARFVAH